MNEQQPNPSWKRTLWILFFNQLISVIGFSSIFPFLPLYAEELGSSTGMSIELLAGLVFSGQAFSMMIASPIWGSLADRFGRKLMIQRAAFSGTILLLIMAFVQSAEQLVLMRTIQGLVTGTMAANNALVAAVAPRKESGYAMGLMQTAMGVGIAVGPLIGGAIADAYGYSYAFYVTSALLFTAGMLVTVGIKEPPRRQVEEDSKPSLVKEWKSIFSTPGVTPTFFMRFLSRFARMTIVAVLPFFARELIAEEAGLNTFVGLAQGVLAGAATLSAVWLGKLGDRIGHKKILVSSALATAIFYFPQAYVTESWQLLVLQGLTGVAVGGLVPSISALLANYTPSGQEGAVYGLDNSISAAGRSVAPLMGSYVTGLFGTASAFIAASLIALTTSISAQILLPKPPSELAKVNVLRDSRRYRG
jgi:DHA1 family multidrug resistance protein-like MFS transporter